MLKLLNTDLCIIYVTLGYFFAFLDRNLKNKLKNAPGKHRIKKIWQVLVYHLSYHIIRINKASGTWYKQIALFLNKENRAAKHT